MTDAAGVGFATGESVSDGTRPSNELMTTHHWWMQWSHRRIRFDRGDASWLATARTIAMTRFERPDVALAILGVSRRR